LLALLTVGASLTEGLGLLMLVPLLELLQQGALANDGGSRIGRFVQQGLAVLGIPLTLESLLLLFLALVALRAGVQYGQALVSAAFQHRVVDGLRERVFRVLLEAEWRWLASHRRGDVASTLLHDVSRVGIGLQFAIQLAVGLTTMLIYLLAALALDAKLTLIAVIGGGLTVLAVRGQQRAAFGLGRRFSEAQRAMMGSVDGSLGNLKLAKILGTERRQLDYFVGVIQRLRTQQLGFVGNTSRTRFILQVLGAALLASYLYLGLEVLHTPVAELLILVLIAARLVPMIAASLQQSAQVLHALPAARETEQLIRAAEVQAEPRSTGGEPAPQPTASIGLHQVSVSYQEREVPALDRVSVCFPAHTTTAIIGPSGAGKSTLADVLMGLLKPDRGALLIDGLPLSEDQRLRWRSSVAYVPQETFLFNDSIRNNLRWGDPEADDATLRTALEQAAAEFVLDLPLGLDTPVGDDGRRLSGGERQRIALARALLKRPALILLDEATSALDVETEAQVRRAIERLQGATTVVMIGHRLATLEHADQVVVMEQGRIQAIGTWEEIRTSRATPSVSEALPDGRVAPEEQDT
jgi:ATP-binding cassette subfamily C protein